MDCEPLSGPLTNTVQSYSERDNVNFYVSGGLLRYVGEYVFTASFFRNGRKLGTHDLGRAFFNPTKDLRLLVVLENVPLSTAGMIAVGDALLRVSRNFPLRRGVGPLDGDLSQGLRFVVDPVPLSFNWPNWGPVRQRLVDFNNSQVARGRPDKADLIMTVRDRQPGEPLLAGTADLQGTVSGVVYNPGSDYFGSVVCQELGHNFGINHSPNPAIVDPTAFDLLNHRQMVYLRSFMFNPVGAQDQTLFEPADWEAVRQGLLMNNSTGPQ